MSVANNESLIKQKSASEPIAAENGRGETGSLQRGLALLDALLTAERPLTATELTEATGNPLSSVHRLLQVLVRQGYAVRDRDRRYLAGPKSLLPLNLYHPLNVLRREAVEPLRALREHLRQTTTLIAFLGLERIVVELAIENDSLSPYHATHLKSPLHGAASGKVLLANLSLPERQKLLGPGPLVQCTPHTITDVAALEQELETVRRQGFAVAIDENHVGLTAVAAPIQPKRGRPIGCFVVAGLTSQFGRDNAYAGGHALKTAANLFSMGSAAVRTVATTLGRASIGFPSDTAD